MSSKISICQISGYYGYGGISRFVTDLTLKLSYEFDVTFVCRKVIGKPEDNLNIIELKPKNTLDYWSKLRELVNNFDIVHCHDVYALVEVVRNKGKAKIVYTDHGIVPIAYSKLTDIPGTIFAYACAKYAIPKVDLAVGISDYIVAELNNKYKNAVKIPDAIDLDKFRVTSNNPAYNKNKLALLRVGLLDKQKGVKFLIESMPRILNKFPDVSLVLIGVGRDEKLLKDYAKKKGLEKYIYFLGFVEDISNYYNSADIVIIPSYWESFSLPIIEAMACGKPVIVRDAYAMREHILNSEAGILFNRDDPEELVDAIRNITSNYEKYALNARRYAERFDLNRIASEYAKVYFKILGGEQN